ncbi:amidase [Mesorhizobium sp. CO1-1-8]|uniref:amidase n=1 Tax=Mesorhizobium sp. CO1-1-8 TaxID=2876631 RepID=UPI001CD16EB9|nr:amidase [Mesorhizobium sp. CO1-1-8]MBZ9772377.1 amidase [Mesorhizobium sp. CO1-1-8]
MAIDDLHYLGLKEIGDLIRLRRTTSLAVTEALLERIATRADLNAFIVRTADLALEQAHRADSELGSGKVRGLMHGVPIALKDIVDMTGFPTTAGMPIRRNAAANSNATVVQRLEDAGAVILGKLNLTEGVYAEHLAPYGPPLNPWDRNRWPGASSSGSGVAVAAGLCYGAVSSDTGGSIRLPSAANGVTGLKPTWGRVSRHGVFELAATLDHVGPMTRNAVDAGLMLGVMAGFDPSDPTSSSLPVPDYLATLNNDLSDLRIGLDRDWVSNGTDAATVAALMQLLEIMRFLGAEIVEIEFPDPSQIVFDWFGVCAAQTALAHAETFPSRKAEYGPALADLLELGNRMSATEYQKVMLRREEFAGRVQAVFRHVDLIACPVLAFPVPTLERMSQVDDEMISGLHRFTCSFTMSRNPTITLPGGKTADGMPIAVQLVAPHFQEASLVRAGQAFQSATSWHLKHPAE